MTSADVTVGADGVPRCWWCGDDPLYVDYHDREWGVPLRDERALFELLCLEGFQSGLSWITILRKRDAFREAFEGFDPAVVAGFDEPDVERLLANPGIVRHRGKITATIGNARALGAMRAGGTSLVQEVWSHAPLPRPAALASRADIPAETPDVGHGGQGAAEVGHALRRSHDRLRLHAIGRPRRRPPRGVPSGGRRQRSPSPSRSLARSQIRRARSAAAAKAAASPAVPAASPMTCTSG